ncbi:hypothetical protein OJAV_G00143870 [Oryzias javanicus]|uniref:Uncharacterized protein n=1 Tax=Oryzias javanicus TaxID=123683 RepID=A0A437CN08_ORYJA|nr:hypothetical protein OJAV_G00143870 [Oryzias javanicus]
MWPPGRSLPTPDLEDITEKDLPVRVEASASLSQCAAALQLPEPLVSLVLRWRIRAPPPPPREHLAAPRAPVALQRPDQPDRTGTRDT